MSEPFPKPSFAGGQLLVGDVSIRADYVLGARVLAENAAVVFFTDSICLDDEDEKVNSIEVEAGGEPQEWLQAFGSAHGEALKQLKEHFLEPGTWPE